MDSNSAAVLIADPDALHARGPVGDTPLHLCFLYHGPAHKRLAEFILDTIPAAVLQTYTGDEYRGENCLHIAVVTGDLEGVRMLLTRAQAHAEAAAGSLIWHGAVARPSPAA